MLSRRMGTLLPSAISKHRSSESMRRTSERLTQQLLWETKKGFSLQLRLNGGELFVKSAPFPTAIAHITKPES